MACELSQLGDELLGHTSEEKESTSIHHLKILGSLPYYCFLKFAGTSRISSLLQIVFTFNVDGLLAFVLPAGVGLLYVAVVFFGCAEVLLGGIVVLLGHGDVVILLVLGGVVASSPRSWWR